MIWMATMTFINLPVKDLAKSTEFFTRLGFSFDQQSTDASATRTIISEEASVMLASRRSSRGSSHPWTWSTRPRAER